MTTSLPSVSPESSGVTAGTAAHSAADGLGAFGAIFAAQPGTDPGAVFGELLGAADAASAGAMIAGVACPALPQAAGPAARESDAPLATESSCTAVAQLFGAEVEQAPRREEVEAALALLAPLWLSAAAQPEPVSMELVAPAPESRPTIGGTENAGSNRAVLDADSAAASKTSDHHTSPSVVALTVPGRGTIEVASTDTPATAAEIVERWTAAPMTAAETRGAQPTPNAASAGTPRGASAANENATSLRADLTLSDGTQLCAEVDSPRTRAVATKPSPAALAANSAASPARAIDLSGWRNAGAEKNSLSSLDTSVNAAPAEGGIAVAQGRATMSAFVPAPVVSADAAASGATLAAEFGLAASPIANAAARASEGAAREVAALAHRAVDAVETVVDAQAAARLQPAPGVSLRFRVGEQDLAVRIEWRAGEVHTEFRTNSPELRQAVTQEWRAMTARADAPARLVDPVFTTNNDAGANGQSFAQQQHSSQHQQAQQQAMAREVPAEFFGRRFAPTPESPALAPAVAGGPLAPATSRRLSAVA